MMVVSVRRLLCCCAALASVASGSSLAAAAAAAASGGWTPPRPTPRQLDLMGMEFAQFMHFGINTFWNASDTYLHGDNPTFHNCYWGVDPAGPDAQTGKHYPCLDPKIFNPTDLNCDDWMRAAKALGTKEICLTAQHEVRRNTPPFAPFLM